MEFVIGIIVVAIVLFVIFKVFRIAFKYAWKFFLNGMVGLFVLIIFNLFGHILGIPLELNFLNATIAGFLGIPGIILLLIFQYVI